MTLSITINKTQHSAHFLIKSADCLACLSMGSRLLFFYSFAQIRERAFPVFHATVSIFLPKHIFVNAAHRDSKIVHDLSSFYDRDRTRLCMGLTAGPVRRYQLPFLSPGGNMGPRYVQWPLFHEKISKMPITQQPLKLLENVSIYFEYLEFWKSLNVSLAKFETILKNYLIKLATDFKWQPSNLLAERSSFFFLAWI